MGLIAVPNVSEGRDAVLLERLSEGVTGAGARVLDVHSDGTHNRSVLTVAGQTDHLIEAMVRLADEARAIDLDSHEGVHPRLGALDVCPFVPIDEVMVAAIEAARITAERIGVELGIPVFLYGEAAEGPGRSLPELRQGGLDGLIERVAGGLSPDRGPRRIESGTGVVCVGARGPLIAFNVWLRTDRSSAAAIAARIRGSSGGLPGVRALGLQIDDSSSQVSMNLTEPSRAGIDDAYESVRGMADAAGIEVIATEIVGLPPERFMPDPEREATRLLRGPGRSLESALSA